MVVYTIICSLLHLTHFLKISSKSVHSIKRSQKVSASLGPKNNQCRCSLEDQYLCKEKNKMIQGTSKHMKLHCLGVILKVMENFGVPILPWLFVKIQKVSGHLNWKGQTAQNIIFFPLMFHVTLLSPLSEPLWLCVKTSGQEGPGADVRSVIKLFPAGLKQQSVCPQRFSSIKGGLFKPEGAEQLSFLWLSWTELNLPLPERTWKKMSGITDFY